jgi:hypothetical protein
MSIQVPPDSTGKLVETNSPDGVSQRQVVTVGDKTATNTLAIDASGRPTVVLATGSVVKLVDTAGTNQAAVSAAGAVRIDPTGTTTQPVSGTVTVQQATGTNLHVVVDSAPTTAVTGTFWQTTQPVSGTFWQTTQPVSGTFWQSTQPVSIATAPALVASSAIIGKVGIDQTTPGTTNGVQVNAALPAGSNVIGHVITDTGSTTAVTGNVTAVQATGSNLHVVVDTAPTTAVTGPLTDTQLRASAVPVSLAANQSVNVAQVNGVTPLMGNGVTGTGSQRVTIASDNTPFSVNVVIPDTTATGNITTQNLVPAGTATANSAVLSGAIQGETTLGIQVTGTYTGALSLQGTIDNTNWVTIGGNVFINVASSAQSATIASGTTGIFQSDCAGFQQVRVTGLAAMTGTATVTLRLSTGTGLVALDTALPAGTNSIGTVQPGNTANTTPWLVTQTPAVSGGCSKFHLVSAATTNLTNVKASAGQLFGWRAFNTNAATRYIKLHNTAGTPTAGAGVVETIAVPGGGGSNGLFDTGVAFSTGIGLSMVTGIADADTTAVGASDLVVDLYFK